MLLRTVVTLSCSVYGAVAAFGIKGVDPAKLHLYQGKDLHCPKNPKKKLTIEMINDDFCDCPEDGFDEPGTAACAEGVFYCKNDGFLPKTIKSFMVNDGVCDCCDGSDEQSGSCPNTCAAEKKEHDRIEAEKADRLARGLKRRQELIEEAKKIRAEANKRLDALQVEVQVVENQLQVTKKAMEHMVPPEVEQQNFESHCAQLQEKFEKVRDIFDSLRDKSNVCEACEEAIEQFDRLDGSKAAKQDEPEKKTLVDDLFSETTSEDRKKSIWESIKNWDFKDLRALFGQHRVTKTVTVTVPLTARTTTGKIQDSPLVQLERKLDQAKADLEQHKAKYGQDFGPEDVYLPFLEQCFESDLDKYSYKVCLFQEVYQKETQKQYAHDVSLGKWNQWVKEENHAMFYDNGQYCWQGPRRNTKVQIECGPENAILSVEEPSICVYVMKIQSPAAC